MLWVSAQTQAEGTVHSQHADPAGARDEKDTAAAQEGPQVCESTLCTSMRVSTQVFMDTVVPRVHSLPVCRYAQVYTGVDKCAQACVPL